MPESPLTREVETGCPREWRESYAKYRRCRNRFLATILLFPVAGALAEFIIAATGLSRQVAVLAVGLVFLPSFFYHGFSMVWWPCPRCQRLFHVTWYWSNALARRCLHCRLAKSDLA